MAGLGSAGVMFGAVGAASDLMQDFRTGYLTLASAKVCLFCCPFLVFCDLFCCVLSYYVSDALFG